MTIQTIALFGSTGQLGSALLHALLHSPCRFEVVQIIPPGAEAKAERHPNMVTKVVDLTLATRPDLARVLAGVDVVICALSGRGMESQAMIQDAAWDARVKRFYPSEFGMHLVYRRGGGCEYGFLHPIWNAKSKYNEQAIHHPAISSGEMTYTLIGCGDIFNQTREKTWCPWTQTNVSEYVLPIIGDPNARIDFTHLEDLGGFLVETILHPERSENATVNFVSDHISYTEIAGLLEKYSGKRVKLDVMPLEIMHKVIENPEQAPERYREACNSFPVDFWFLLKGMQGEGRFWWPKGRVHNGCFPEVEVTTFEAYFKGLFGDYYI